MHEVSIARSILKIVEESVPSEDLRHVQRINVKIGAGAGVMAGSVEFSFRALASQTALSSASLHIENTPFVIRCHACGAVSTVDPYITLCPKCFSGSTEIRSGTELQIVSIELAEEHHEHPHR